MSFMLAYQSDSSVYDLHIGTYAILSYDVHVAALAQLVERPLRKR